MAFLVIYVLDNMGQMPDVLEAWQQAGAPGITILESTGMERLRRAALREDLPLIPSLSDLLHDENVYHKTLLTVTEDEAVVDRIVEATRQIVGDFSQHHTGILCVLPLLRVYGLDKPGRGE
jgi:nitrogen regulatory protein PII